MHILLTGGPRMPGLTTRVRIDIFVFLVYFDWEKQMLDKYHDTWVESGELRGTFPNQQDDGCQPL